MSNSGTHGGGNSRRERIEKICDKEIFFLKMWEAIDELPESQQQFYKDLFEAGRSQSEVARIYNISPQAVTNRLKKLTKTVKKKMETDYGYTEEDIMGFIDAGSIYQLIIGDI